ncbi:hypothetical protein BZB76_2826 [Actinomadura pelletieri DSM 43383]|uniref:Uncharacterized protein n=1 Tax=Actinomadura pelletieri DSM 43383 TaxID=1120940 RepID=A0A495QMV0_9ACTN|nr:hypothetical protein [Actinomadura pelletieri]RKS74315.1 hypothetical protein BZB76_2826 [Actinomadura pelletieri DSM 43383]
MIWIVAGLVAAALGAGAVITFWDTVRTTVENWLNAHSLNKGALQRAVIVLDKGAVRVRRRIVVQTSYAPQIISEESLSLDQIDVPEVRALLERHDQVEIDILHDL